MSSAQEEAIATIRDLCRLISADPLPAADLAARVGATLSDGGPGASIRLRPASPAFGEALLVRRPSGDEPAHLELTLAEPAALRLRDLGAAFGPPRALPRSRPGAPRRFSIAVDLPGAPRTCTILASLAPAAGDPADAPLQAITLRRDIRLP